jgi:serine O-acetyltransferase
VNSNDDLEPTSAPRALEVHGSNRSLPARALTGEDSSKVPLWARLSRTDVAKFVQLVREDLEAHDGDWTRAGFQALLVYRFGVWRMSVRRKLFRAPLSVLWRALFAAVRNFYGIELPFTARIGRRVIFEHQHGIVVHGNTEIGDDCIIRQGVTLGIRRLDRLKEAPVLGKHVNVGAGAKILGHVLIGDHAEIGANAVVLENVPPYTLAIGVPAHNVTRDAKGRTARRERIPRSSRAAPASTRTNGVAANGPVSNAPGSTIAGNRPH